MEFQKSGNVHFHILLSVEKPITGSTVVGQEWAKCSEQFDDMSSKEKVLYSSLRDRKERDVKTAVITANSLTRTWENVRTIDGCARYVTKYATKTYQKYPPKYWRDIGRFWGISRGARQCIENCTIEPVTENQVRDALKQANDKRAEWDFLPKILFACPQIVSRETLK